jgi:hypothetical protein
LAAAVGGFQAEPGPLVPARAFDPGPQEYRCQADDGILSLFYRWAIAEGFAAAEPTSVVTSTAHNATAKQVALEGSVLLKKAVVATHIMWRLRRTTIEDCYVSVPVTNLVMDFDESGAHRLNLDKVHDAAIAIGRAVRGWVVESTDIEIHPLQGPLPEARILEPGWPDGQGGYMLDS